MATTGGPDYRPPHKAQGSLSDYLLGIKLTQRRILSRFEGINHVQILINIQIQEPHICFPSQTAFCDNNSKSELRATLFWYLNMFIIKLCVLQTDTMAENDVDNELLDYEEDEEPQGAPESATPAGKKEVKGSYVSIHSSGFRDFLLKPELLRAIIDCGFEHPSEGELHLMFWFWLRRRFLK